jgi:hypothetical protein
MLPLLVLALFVGTVGLVVSVERRRVTLVVLLFLGVVLAVAMVVAVGARSMKACELEEGLLIGYAISRSYDRVANSVECRRTSETGEVKISTLSVWHLLRSR